MSKLIDKLFPIFVGQRSEVSATVLACLQFVKAATVTFGVEIPPSVYQLADQASAVVATLIPLFLAAKANR